MRKITEVAAAVIERQAANGVTEFLLGQRAPGTFYPFGQDHYLEICAHGLAEFGMSPQQIEAARGEALQWTLMRGSRSGRVACQFARDYAGRHAKRKPTPQPPSRGRG